MNRLLLHPAAKPLAGVLCALPLVALVVLAADNGLGANPAEAVIRHLGDLTLRALCLTLAVTPLRQLSGWTALSRFRRMFGLYAFFYGVLHLLAYAWLDMGLQLGDILRDIAKRPFILVGSLALVLMLPLAATSWHGAVRALGARRWQVLHRAVYAVAVLGVLHFFWMRASKNNVAEVTIYAVILGALLGWRAWRAMQRRSHGD